ncbi:MAG: permease-like cell division protein FtsX [Bacteroidaceae bacterium]
MKQNRKKKARGYTNMNVVTSCISTTLVLLLLGTIVFFVTIGSHLSDALRENFTVTLMLNDDIRQQEAYNLQAELREMKCNRCVGYISKDKALKEQAKAMGTDPTEFLGENPIPASFELHLNAAYANADSLSTIIPLLEKKPSVIEVNYPQALMDSVNENIRKISLTMLIIAALLMIVSFELINNTIRLSVYSHRFLIHTMKLVGARWSFIRKPFMARAFWIGIVSALLANGLIVSGIVAIVKYEPEVLKLITFDVIGITIGIVFGCGIVLTLACAYFSVNKHLRMTSDKMYYI